MSLLKVSSCNARGLRQQRKRRQVFSFLHRHRRDIFCIQETHSTREDEKYWANEWGGKVVFNHGTSSSRGVCVLFNPTLTFIIQKCWTCNSGRAIILDICINQKNFTLVCLYGPNLDDPTFFDLVNLQIVNFPWDSVVIAGDFNFVFNLDLDKKGGNLHTNFNARNSCHNLMNCYDLVDIWRERNPHNQRFTWTSSITNDIHCRLDFFLISRSLMYSTRNATITPSLNSDHSMINLDLSIDNEQRGPGFWKFNNALLNDIEYLTMVTDIIDNVKNACVNNNPVYTWDYMKYSIRKSTVTYSKCKAQERRRSENEIINEVSRLEQALYHSDSSNLQEKLKEARCKLQTLYDYKIQGIMVRSRARWVEEGERNSRYFLNLEKRNKSNNVIRKLVGADGTEIFTCKGILSELKRYYSLLYISEGCVPDTFYTNVANNKKLSDEQALDCDGQLSSEECKTALFSLSNNKSPGSDGFSVEFYKHFWPLIGDVVTNSLNYSYQNVKMSDEQGRGIITLIPKPNKDPTHAKNYRPISLLNVDYKLCSKALASRLKSVISYVVNDNQTGFVKGRFIGENIRYILDSIDYCKDNDVRGFILLIDFEKAFDKLEWGFIYSCLRYFNFKDSFIQWISTLYSNATACVCNNGFSSSFFNISRGVRQGCPISPYLFTICVELLALCIHSSPEISGLSIMGHETRIIQYADDTCLFLDGSYSSLKAVEKIFRSFQISSGLTVNFEKSHVFPLGPFTHSKPKFLNDFRFSWTTGPVTALGITFDHCKDNLFRLNFPPKLSRLKNIFNLWSQRDLTPIGKITLVKSFGISQLVYLFQILPNPPDKFIKDVESCIFNFIWNGKRDKIKRTTLIAPISEGGLNVTHISTFIHSLKCAWVRRYLDDTKGSWKDYFNLYLSSRGGSFLFKCNFDANDITTSNSFVNDICIAWSRFKSKVPTDDFGSEIIWNNKHIRVNNKSIFYKYFYDKNVFCIRDLFDENNRILSYNHFTKKFNLKCPFTVYFGMINAIPRHWKHHMMTNNTADLRTVQPTEVSEIYPYTSRVIYRHMITKIYSPPTSLSKWNQTFPGVNDEWSTIFRIPFLSLRETKLQYFQFRFLHRILGTNVLRHRMKLTHSPSCTFCGEHNETIEHLFWDCRLTSSFLLDVEQIMLGQQFFFSKEDFFFGYKFLPRHPYNFLIFYMKYYIFAKKLNESIPTVNEFLYKFKFHINVEKYILGNRMYRKGLTLEDYKSAFTNYPGLFD